jgi:hypothetical protein
MSNLLTAAKASSARRQQLSLERWPEERAKGKGQFVLRKAFAYTVLMTALHDVVNHILADGQASLWSNTFKYACTGIFMACMWWWDHERKYKNAQLNASRHPFDNRITPR